MAEAADGHDDCFCSHKSPMSLEQLEAFLVKIKGDSNFQEKLKAVKLPSDFVGIAKEHGHESTIDKLGQLSDKELEGVTGGAPYSSSSSSGCGGAVTTECSWLVGRPAGLDESCLIDS